MFPLMTHLQKQGSADPRNRRNKIFAPQGRPLHADLRAWGRITASHLCTDCCPSPSWRSGLMGARPSFAGMSARSGRAGCSAAALMVRFGQELCFSPPRIGVECRTITNLTRGRKSWSSQSSFWALFSHLHWQAACRTPQRAVWQAGPPVWSLRMRWTPTLPPGPSSAVLPVSRPAGSISGFLPATDLTRAAHSDAAVFRPAVFRTAAIRARARMAFLHVCIPAPPQP